MKQELKQPEQPAPKAGARVPLCKHLMQDGARCRAFAVRGEHYCRHHLRYKGMRLWTGRRQLRRYWRLRLPKLDSMANVATARACVEWAENAGLISAEAARLHRQAFKEATDDLTWIQDAIERGALDDVELEEMISDFLR